MCSRQPSMACLRIVDSEGQVLAFNHDGSTLDPILGWTAPRDGTFIVQLMGFAYPASSSVQFTGGEGCVYRLHLSTAPFAKVVFPLAVQRGKTAEVKVAGWNLPEAKISLVATAGEGTNGLLELPETGGAAVRLSDFSEHVEQEPNEVAAGSQLLEVPAGCSGRIGADGDEDRFRFTALKGRSYDIGLSSGRLSPLDAWLRIENSAGKELARADDAGSSRDPRLVWTAPSDGEHVIAVGEVTHRGGENFLYHLTIAEAVPMVSATASAASATVESGKTSELKVTVKFLHGFKAKLELQAKGLPAGLSAEPVEVPEKGGEVVVKLAALSEAAPGGQPLQLTLREIEGGREYPVVFALNSVGEDNGVPQGYAELLINTTDQLWLTVLPAAAK